MRQAQQEVNPSREAITNIQLSGLLAVLKSLEPYLFEPHAEVGQENPQLDGGALASATVTFIKACNRLDALLDDPARWTMDGHDQIHRAIMATQMEQQRFLQAQQRAAEIVQRPSYQLRPTIVVVDTYFVAYYGDASDASRCIVGRGDTPEKALIDFDEAFKRTPDKQWLVQPAAEPQPKPSRKKK